MFELMANGLTMSQTFINIMQNILQFFEVTNAAASNMRFLNLSKFVGFIANIKFFK